MAEAVGSMCHLMPSDKLEEQLPRIIPAIMSLYKKNTEHYIISKVGTNCPEQTDEIKTRILSLTYFKLSVVNFNFYQL